MKVVVFSGGTATNSLTPSFNQVSIDKGDDLTYVLPISDNGGSTSEILRVLGGPAVGDIRSRIVRLIQDSSLAHLFGYRLPSDPLEAKVEWNLVVEGAHKIWTDIPVESRDMCRPFLIHVQAELLKKSKNSNPFHFEKASIGNLFLTGVRLFLGSLDASIELMLRVGRCSSHLNVVPCINTNHTHHISALLLNGEVITGQSQISHPSKPLKRQAAGNETPRNKKMRLTNSDEESSISGDATPSVIMKDKFVQLINNDSESGKPSESPVPDVGGLLESQNMNDFTDTEEEEFANPISILPVLKESQINFDKMDDCTLPAPIKRILYINPYGEEIRPIGNPRVVSKIKKADMLVYSIGSLMTSLLPVVILGNIADVICETKNLKKVLLVNNKYDRETFFMSGSAYIKILVDSMSRAIINYRKHKGIHRSSSKSKNLEWKDFFTDIVFLSEGEIKMNETQLSKKGIRCHIIEGDKMENDALAQVLEKIAS
ncbi:hypothetical protein RNJ44_01753 [Nakaseomyces bracarensis]|uniref:Uncharacterized protein n=1 Tax=Nakaseomyces bracarensis TaxID=273131 RepID=A0ABR4NNP1_9SACH